LSLQTEGLLYAVGLFSHNHSLSYG